MDGFYNRVNIGSKLTMEKIVAQETLVAFFLSITTKNITPEPLKQKLDVMLPLHIEDCKLYFPIKHILINKFYYFNTIFNTCIFVVISKKPSFLSLSRRFDLRSGDFIHLSRYELYCRITLQVRQRMIQSKKLTKYSETLQCPSDEDLRKDKNGSLSIPLRQSLSSI